jgi:glycosyltransferase involved in cell wall biosynthesis
MNKINILVIPPDTHGVGAFRFIEPHIEIQKKFGDDFYVDINPTPNWDDTTYLDNFQIIFGSKNMLHLSKAKEIFPKLREQGKVIILDIDDHWELSKNHPQYSLAKEIKHAEHTVEYFSLVDHITTTTEYFANQIRKYNKNVVVFPNGVDPTAKKFQINTEPSDKVRLGWLGGSSHLFDLKLLKRMFDSVNDKYKDKIQTVLCGFDIRGKVQDRDPYGNTVERDIHPTETPWYYYEKIFTSDYRNLNKDYIDYLMTFKKEPYLNEANQPYRRVWTKPLSTYSLNYNLFDISLVPLEVTKFNLAKSQLKIIESGFFKKPVICSDVAPYQIDIKHGENGFLVKENSNKDWSYYIKNLIESPELRKEMGEKLYESVKDKYDLRNISADRAEFYKTTLK